MHNQINFSYSIAYSWIIKFSMLKIGEKAKHGSIREELKDIPGVHLQLVKQLPSWIKLGTREEPSDTHEQFQLSLSCPLISDKRYIYMQFRRRCTGQKDKLQNQNTDNNKRRYYMCACVVLMYMIPKASVQLPLRQNHTKCAVARRGTIGRLFWCFYRTGVAYTGPSEFL